MSTFELKFDTDNAAFEEDSVRPEIARILRELADRVELYPPTGMFQNIKDINGNIVGTWRFK